ncbi:MAG: Rho termination factor N-terminal domain-containing protein, partial [Actinomycetota bacterium]
MSTPELDRSLLERKDRDELHAIAGAVGVKAPTRMRKADLITAILDAAGAATPATSAAKPRTVRSARASAVAAASVEAIAAEENALAADAAEPEIAPRPRRNPASARAAAQETEAPAEP